jgi:nicotinamide-nucleotide amidase
MREMIAGAIIPNLQKRAGSVAVIKSRTLRTWGQSESGLAELLAPRIAALEATGNPTLAFLASGIEGIKVRITAKGKDHNAAQRILEEEDARLRSVLCDLVFGVDGQTMESVVVGLLRERNLTLAVAESLTGGLMSARLTAVPHANEVLRGSIVFAANDPEPALLRVSALPSEPEATTKALALAVCRMFHSSVGLAAVGAVGMIQPSTAQASAVYLGAAIGNQAEVRMVRLPGDRERVRQFAVINLLNLLRLQLAARH